MAGKRNETEDEIIDLLRRLRIGELADPGDELATYNINELTEMLTKSGMDDENDEDDGEVALSPRKNPGDGLAGDRFAKLDADSLYLVQLCAIGDEPYTRGDLLRLSEAARSVGELGRRITKKRMGQIVDDLLRRGFIVYESYSTIRISPGIQDAVVQDAVRKGRFEPLSAIFTERPGHWLRGRLPLRAQRLAFYTNQAEQFLSNLSEMKRYEERHGEEIGLLEPFSADIFEALDPSLQRWYLIEAVPRLITRANGSPALLREFDSSISRQTSADHDLLAVWMDLSFARGDLESLRRLDDETGRRLHEVRGCIALLEGDLEQAKSCLESVMPGGKKKGKLAPVAHLPAILYLLLLVGSGTPAEIERAQAIVRSVNRARKRKYEMVTNVIELAISFRRTPLSPPDLLAALARQSYWPLSKLLAGYCSRWFLSDEDRGKGVPGLKGVAKAYRSLGLDWLAAEAHGLAAEPATKTGEKHAEKHRSIHEGLGTSSLIELAVPEPAWKRSLDAIAGIVASDGPTAATPLMNERIIWELDTRHDGVNLEAFLQRRSGRSWTKGRKVALKRLYEQFESASFSFLSDQDRALCQALVEFTEQRSYGYRELAYRFDEERAARALIGHPRVFPPGDRENPIEIVEREPQLVVAHQDDGRIALSLEPRPLRDDESFRMSTEASGRRSIVFFGAEHLRLHRLLGGTLKVPAAAADRVIETLQKVASVISVQSEIGGQVEGGVKVEADARPHVHLQPYQDGLRLDLYVQPFGDGGPFYRPGTGGETIFASIDGRPTTTIRDPADEARLLDALIDACPTLATRMLDDFSVCCPSPAEALEVLVELESLADEQRVTLHWPQGRSLTLAGQASHSQLRLHIRKDRDWFAASGSLDVDSELSLDLLRLIELVEANPSRFVRMDDGRFLALTEQLRRRVEELAAYGDRRSNQKKLRFPPVRAAALEAITDTAKLKSDKHWKAWIRRMHDAADVRAEVPSTLRTELRDYQREGFQWLARLAAWGVGGCLADDMGLGKTIQALALLLDRAPDGPALVVAPTSVAFNWMTEARRFAPTLDAHLFGEGDREALLANVGSHDLVICTYGLLHAEAARLQAVPWHTVVLDEAQAIKNTATRRSQAAMKLKADFRLIMTGTPLENHLGELWNLFDFINPGLLGSLDSFQTRFALPIERDRCRETRRRLKRLIQPFILRRTKSQVMEELPPRTEVIRRVDLSDEEAAFYEALRKRAIEKLKNAGDEGPRHLEILAEIMRLRRACCHPRLVLDDCDISGSKLALFSETLDELLANGHKALVYSQFVDHLEILRRELERKGISHQYLDGSTPARQRKQRVEAFQAGDGDIFLVSLKAGGLGLNLTAADYVLHMDPWWNPATEDQASDRAHRLGQRRPVTIYRFISKGTIEEKITAMHTQKRALADSLLEGASISGKLSAEELLALIRA
ncbi:MAG: DEAD/DEAH box helicase [Polyangia bacterium]